MRKLPWLVAPAALALAVALALLPTAPPAAEATTYTAGLTTSTGSDDFGNNNGMSATQVTSGSTGGDLTQVSLYVRAVNAAPSNHGQVAVYADSANLPGAKLAASGSQVLTANSWNNFPLTGASIAASTKYWLVFNVDGAGTKYRITTGGRATWKIPTAFGTWPATFGTPSNPANGERYAINMTWTDTAPPTTTAPPTSSTVPPTTTTEPPPTTTTAPPPPPGGFPDGSNTGVPAGTTLTNYAGSCTITAANTVIDSKTVNCPDGLDIKAGGVQITKSKINGNVWLDTDLAGSTGWSVTLTDTEVDAGTVLLAAVTGNITLLRANVHGGVTAAQCDNTVVCNIQDSWLHGQYLIDNVNWHLGGFLSDGATGLTLIHNRIVCDHPVNNQGEGCTGDLNLIPNFQVISQVQIKNNLFGANTGSAYCTYGGDRSDKTWGHADHVVYQDNVFERGTNGRCADYGPVTGFNSAGVGNQWINNKWDDGAVVNPA